MWTALTKVMYPEHGLRKRPSIASPVLGEAKSQRAHRMPSEATWHSRWPFPVCISWEELGLLPEQTIPKSQGIKEERFITCYHYMFILG